ncbi:tetratricopeptide repeat protein [Flagellimonas baculiformis]|uniref:tetratricopeptide repeat protein n=1 Tax=Flagellimonas baculiformis TaxID=3067310 RepID=UPI00296E9FDF|nr:hypothetical protein [Muricauda sp. D6]
MKLNTLQLVLGIIFAIILSGIGWKINQSSDERQDKLEDNLLIERLIELRRVYPSLNKKEFLTLAANRLSIPKKRLNNLIKTIDKDDEDDFHLAMKYYLNDDFEKALPIFDNLSFSSQSIEKQALSLSFLGDIQFYGYHSHDPKTLNLYLRAYEKFEKIELKSFSVVQSEAYNNYRIGALAKLLGDNKTAKKHYEKAISQYSQLVKEDDIVINFLGPVYNDLYILGKKIPLGEPKIYYLDKALEYKKEAFNKYPSSENLSLYLNSINAKGNYYLLNDNLDLADVEYNLGLQLIKNNIKEKLTPQFKLIKAKLLSQLSESYITRYKGGKNNNEENLLKKAEDYLTQAESLVSKLELQNPSDKLTKSIIYYDKGSLYQALGKYELSLNNYQTCLDIREDIINGNANIDFHAQYAHVLFEIAKLYSENSEIKDCSEAEFYAEKAKNLYLKTSNADSSDKNWFKEIDNYIEKNCSKR